MPEWWKVPKQSVVLAVLFRALCLMSMARPTLKHHWRSKIDDNEWEKHRKMVIERLNNTNIAVGNIRVIPAVY